MARPRSSEAHEKVLDAALSLFAGRGIEGTSMDAIAREAGVSKATIYNHWPDKEALLMETMLRAHGLGHYPDQEQDEPDSGDIERDLAAVLTRRPPERFAAARNRIMPAMIAYSNAHPEFGKAWRERVVEPSRKSIQRILRRGIRRGQIPPRLDLEFAIALLLGPVFYDRILRKGAPNSRSTEIGARVAELFAGPLACSIKNSPALFSKTPSHAKLLASKQM
jgi:AcrR family transcriptional regulator